MVISTKVVYNIKETNIILFDSLLEHIYDTSSEDGHLALIIKNIAEKNSEIRLYHMSKLKTENMHCKKFKKFYTKLNHFKYQ